MIWVEFCPARIRLPVGASVALVMMMSSANAEGPATLAQHDAEWPLDGRTAFLLTMPAGSPMAVRDLRWRGTFYRGEPGPIGAFHIRAYQDAEGAPGPVLTEVTTPTFEVVRIGGNAFAYSTELTPPLSLPAGARVWLEVQALAPGVPQWGVLGIDSPQTDGPRLIMCETLGILRWRHFDWFETPPGGSAAGEHATIGHGLLTQRPTPLLYPNPTSGEPRFAFTLARSTDTRVLICDVSGRVVRTLVNRALDTGQHELVWDTRDENGQPVSSGIYFIQLREQAEELAAWKVVITR